MSGTIDVRALTSKVAQTELLITAGHRATLRRRLILHWFGVGF